MKFDKLVKEAIANNVWYHGSPDTNIKKLEIQDGKFSLLGSGVYFYKSLESAKMYGDNVYKVIVGDNYNIAINNFQLSPNDLNSIFERYFETNKEPYGIVSPLWWATDGWNYYGYNRKETVNKISKYLQESYNFDGMTAIYPNGGLVLCLWRKYDELFPELIV